MNLRATYSPDDNKLRLYSDSRLDADTYQRVRAAGFRYAPKQELFFAPRWHPYREDLLVELCGEIEDEDTTLVERAEQRADRYGEFSDRRAEDAESARAGVKAIADCIPFGQPILVGHHSEGRARRDAERIRNGMGRAVRLWDQSAYWQDRARAALLHARYKELPAVRARRIRGLEAERRGHVRDREQAEHFLSEWSKEGITLDRAKAIANFDSRTSYQFPLDKYPRALPASQYEGAMGLWSALDGGVITAEQARDLAVATCHRVIAWADRWIGHLDNRLAYERAMLEEQGGIATDRVKPEKGGACQCWASPGRGRAGSGWSTIVKVNRVSVTVYDNYRNGGANFTRNIPFDKLGALMSKADVDAARADGRLQDTADGVGFYLFAPEPEVGDSPAATEAEDAPPSTDPPTATGDGEPHLTVLQAAAAQVAAALTPRPPQHRSHCGRGRGRAAAPAPRAEDDGMNIFDPVPDEEVPVPRHGGTFFGVRLPCSVPFFDCRWDSARPEPRNPHTGLIMWGTERAEFALGERTAGSSARFAHPAGILTHHDATEPRHAQQTAEDVRRLRGMLARELWEYRKARLNPAAPGEGGGVVFRPVAVALTNFGSTILADRRESLTYRLDGPRPARPAPAKRRTRRAPSRREHAMEGEPTLQLGTA